MRTKARACGRAVRLDRITFVQQTLVVEAFKHVPHRFDITIFEGDIGMLQISPIAHQPGFFFPQVFVAQHGAAAGGVVFLDGYFFTDVLFRNAEFFFHRKFNGQAVRVPAALTIHAVAFQGLVAAKKVFHRTAHHVVDAGLAIGRRRPFVEYERMSRVALLDGLLEDAFVLPELQDFGVDGREIKVFKFAVVHK